jgi:hypothetical protein
MQRTLPPGFARFLITPLFLVLSGMELPTALPIVLLQLPAVITGTKLKMKYGVRARLFIALSLCYGIFGTPAYS